MIPTETWKARIKEKGENCKIALRKDVSVSRTCSTTISPSNNGTSACSLKAGSRKKGGETAFLQADLEITESGRENPKVREATFDQPKAPIGTVSSDFHGIGGEVDFNTMLIDEATDDLFAGLSEAFVSKPWLKSSYISPPPSEESDRVNVWKVDDSLGSLVNATARVSMDSTNRQNNTLEDKLTMAECSKSPSALNVGKATALSGPRPIAASEPLYTTTGCSPAIRYSEGSSQVGKLSITARSHCFRW